MTNNDIFMAASDYVSIILPTIFCLSIVALSDEVFILLKRAVTVAKGGRVRSRRR
jgi:hypothetical protein